MHRGLPARLWTLLALLAICGGALPGVSSADEDPPLPEDEKPVEAGPPEAPPLVDVEALPEITVRPPRVYLGPGEEDVPETVVTPLRRGAESFEVPSAVTVLDSGDLRDRRQVRTTPDALLRVPGVMVQKTAPLQASPFIRGFTGYGNLMMIDGIRLNNAAFRAGPVQYWSTIDAYTISRMEVARGPMAVLYGSDAVGGTINVMPFRRTSFEPGWHMNGYFSTRVASAEDAIFGRLQLEGNYGKVGWVGGASVKDYGDIVSGAGLLPNTGGIHELDGDFRLDFDLGRRWDLTVAYQHVEQWNGPRTHRTIFGVPFAGSTIGSELRRDLDQQRDLVYSRLSYDCASGPIQHAHVGFSYQRFYEERDRERTGARRDLQGFDLDQFGAHFQITTPTRIGRITWGADYYRDEADTWRKDFVAGALTLTAIQGPFADDSRYDLLGVYAQDEINFGRFDLIAGARFTYARAQADRLDNPTVPGSDPATPGNVITLDTDWTRVIGSLRGVYHVNPCWNVYGGVSQAFRTPTLHDLTALDSSSFLETPSPDLDAEDYLLFELGVKTQQQDFVGSAAVWYTVLDGTIVRSPTGAVIDGVAEVRKDNIGDGWIWGFEADVAWRFRPCWLAFANASWADGEVDEFDATSGGTVRSPLSRQKPFTALFGIRWEQPRGPGWAQLEVAHSAKEDRLSLRDKTDTTRIPPGGTPAWTTLSLRAGLDLDARARLGVAIENLLDENYRIHGSGVNEPGTSFVATLDLEF